MSLTLQEKEQSQIQHLITCSECRKLEYGCLEFQQMMDKNDMVWDIEKQRQIMFGIPKASSLTTPEKLGYALVGKTARAIAKDLRTFQHKTIEACAVECEDVCSQNRTLAQNMRESAKLKDGAPLADSAADTATNCAAKIRKLKGAK